MTDEMRKMMEEVNAKIEAEKRRIEAKFKADHPESWPMVEAWLLRAKRRETAV